MGNHKKGNKKGVKQGGSKQGGTQCPLPLFYPQLSDAVAKVRPFWSKLAEQQRKNLLSARLESVRERAKELSKTLQKEAQVARDSSLVFDFEIKSYESVLDEALQRLNCRGSFKVWIGLNGEEFCTREEFQKYLESKLENENYLQVLKRAKQGDGRPEKELQGRMEKLLRVIHEQISKFQQQISKSSNIMLNGYRFPHLRIGCIGGSGVSESLHRKNKLLVRMILQTISKEKHLLFESFMNAIRDFTSRICEEDGVMDVDVEAPYEEFMDDMNMDDVGHLCEWLIEKIDCLASTKWKPSEQEMEEEEDEGDILGDVDLFCLTDDGCNLQPNPKWLGHLMTRQIDADGQPHKVDAEAPTKEKQLSDGLVLDWLYGSIVSTAEKARDAAQKPLGMDRPSLDIELTMLRRSLSEMQCLYGQQDSCQLLVKRLDEMESEEEHSEVQKHQQSDIQRESELLEIQHLQQQLLVCIKETMENSLNDDNLSSCKKEMLYVKKWLNILKKHSTAFENGNIKDVDELNSLVSSQRSSFQQGEFCFNKKIKSVRENCQSTLKFIEDEIFKQEAVVSFFEFNLVNVACDDLGAVIGVEILLPMIQESIEQQADQYFRKQAEQLQQQILEMEAAEKEEAAKKKQRKKNKKKAKKVMCQNQDQQSVEEVTEKIEEDKNWCKGELKEEQVQKGCENISSASCVEQLVIEYLTHHENEIQLVSEPSQNEPIPLLQEPKLLQSNLQQENLQSTIIQQENLQSTIIQQENLPNTQPCSTDATALQQEKDSQNIEDKFDFDLAESQDAKGTTSQHENEFISCPASPINCLEENQCLEEMGNIQEEDQLYNFDEGYLFGSSLDGCSIEDTCYQMQDNNFLHVSHCDGSSEVGCTSHAIPSSALQCVSQGYSGLDCQSECGTRTPDFNSHQLRTSDSNNNLVDPKTSQRRNLDVGLNQLGVAENISSSSNVVDNSRLLKQDVLQKDQLDQLQALLSQTQLSQLYGLLQQSQVDQPQSPLNQLNNNSNQYPIMQVQQGVVPEQTLGRGQKAQSYQSLQDLVSMHQYSSISRPSLESLTSFSNIAQVGLEQKISKVERELNDACKQLTNAVIGLEHIKEQLLCPLTGGLMNDPVVAADGYTYDRAAIEQWLLSSSNSPITEQPLQTLALIPNRSIKGILGEIQELGVVGLVGLL